MLRPHPHIPEGIMLLEPVTHPACILPSADKRSLDFFLSLTYTIVHSMHSSSTQQSYAAH
jgi:hypothetical protein